MVFLASEVGMSLEAPRAMSLSVLRSVLWADLVG